MVKGIKRERERERFYLGGRLFMTTILVGGGDKYYPPPSKHLG